MKINLKDVTFLFPIRLDSVIRLENLVIATNFLLRHFDTNIHILHADGTDNGFIKKLVNRCINYTFVEDYDKVFYRTKYLNIMTDNVDTPIVAIWDSDVILSVKQIVQAVNDIRNGFDVSYPYDGHFYDTTSIIREGFIKYNDVRFLERNKMKMHLIYGDKCKGGAFIVNRESYLNSGKENENFYGWGPEDFERYARWINLGYKINRVEGNLYHLTHGRSDNSKFRSTEQYVQSNKELNRTMQSNKKELYKNIQKNNLDNM